MSETVVEHEHQWVKTGLVFMTVPEQAERYCTICGERRFEQEKVPERGETTELLCDIDGGSMVKKILTEDKVHLECITCDQTWIFQRYGDKIESSCTTLKHLWPSGMKEESKMYREEFLPEWLKEKEFYANSRYAVGFWSVEERDSFIGNCQSELEKWHDEHPLPHYWWQFWKQKTNNK